MPQTTLVTALTLTQDGVKAVTVNDSPGVIYADAQKFAITLVKGQTYDLQTMGLDSGRTRLYIGSSLPVQVLLWTPGTNPLMTTTFPVGMAAVGSVTVGGTITLGNVATITVAGISVSYTVLGTDTTATVATALAAAITANLQLSTMFTASALGSLVTITAKKHGTLGNVGLTVSMSIGATLTLNASGTTLLGGLDDSAPAAGPMATIDMPTSSYLDLTLKLLPGLVQITAPNGSNDGDPEITILVLSAAP